MHKKSRNRPTDHEIVGWANKNPRQPGLFQRPVRGSMNSKKTFTNAIGAAVRDNTNIMTAGPRGPALLQDIWLI
jgi:hypothetical protein